MLKNRTFLGILCIVAAIALVFGISPILNKVFEGKKTVAVLKNPVTQGQQISAGQIEMVEMGSYNLPVKAITDPKQIVGKYAVKDLFGGSLVYADMLSDTFDSSASVLRNLKGNERAMSITIKSFANGVSGKLVMGDVITIISLDEDENAVIFDELEYVEVLTTTTETGSDYLDKSVADFEGEDAPLPETITVILQDKLQALRLTECENNSLYAVFVSRDEKRSEELLKLQLEKLEEINTEIEKEKEENVAAMERG